MSKIQRVGVKFVAEDAAAYISALNNAAKATDQSSKTIEKAGDQSADASKGIAALRTSLGELAQEALRGETSLGGIVSQIGNLSLGSAAALGTVALISDQIARLALRGAPLTGLADSFDRLTGAIEVSSTALLTDLRAAARGTVSDFELIQQANTALSGSQGAFATSFAENLPKVLDIARAQANATGKDINYLFESLVTGVKRSSPLLIDNAGLVLSIGEANATLAASLGKTVEELTASEKQQALLNELLRVGSSAIVAFGDQFETAADKLARFSAGLNNIGDRLSLTLQPAFSRILDLGSRFLSFVDSIVMALSPAVTALFDLASSSFALPFDFLISGFEMLVPVINVFGAVVGVTAQLVNSAFQEINKFLADTVKNFTRATSVNLGLDFNNLARNFGRGAAFVGFAFAIGFEKAKAAIISVVAGIAEAIADFLVGESPPPVGPLSRIDQGGFNVAMSWLDGFSKANLTPVNAVAQQVATLLGNVAQFTGDQVKGRFAQLNAAVQPFADQLTIIKSRFEAVEKPAKAALDAISRQQNKALEALNIGAAGSGAAVRALDRQRESIEKAVSVQQDALDQAEIQLALAQAQQSEERALLSIREAQLKITDQAGQSMKELSRRQAEAASRQPSSLRGRGGGAGDASESEAIAEGNTLRNIPTTNETINALSGQAQQNQTLLDIGTGFLEGQAAGQSALNASLADSASANSRLQTQIGRIGSAAGGGALGKAFGGIGTGISNGLQSAQTFIGEFVANLSDPNNPNGLLGGINRAISAARQFFSDFFELQLPTIVNLGQHFLSTFGSGMIAFFTTPVIAALEGVRSAFAMFFGGEQPNTLRGIINNGIEFLKTIPSLTGEEMAKVGRAAIGSVASTLVGIVNAILATIESTLNAAVSGLAQGFSGLEGPLTALGQAQLYNDLTSSLQQGVTLPRIPVPVIPAAAKGGIFTGGALMVGERGRELMATAASKTAVFPAEVTRGIEVIANALGGGGSTYSAVPTAAYAGANNAYNNDNSITANFYGNGSPANTYQQMLMLRAARG
jgi:hypothetical protein